MVSNPKDADRFDEQAELAMKVLRTDYEKLPYELLVLSAIVCLEVLAEKYGFRIQITGQPRPGRRP